MLFGKRKQVVKRILIVEDEPLTAFDNENILGEPDMRSSRRSTSSTKRCEILEREEVDLDPQRRPPAQPANRDRACQAAKERGVPTLFATGHAYPGAAEIAVGCLTKPYTERQLLKAIECVDRHLQGETVKPPKGLELFVASDEAK